MSQAEPLSQRLWSDWLYERLPLPPVLSGAVLAAALLALLSGLAYATGGFDRLAAKGLAWWQDRDGRLAALVALLAGTMPTALRLHELATRRHLDALAHADLWRGAPPAGLRRTTEANPRAALLFGASGFLLLPIVALAVDGDARFLSADYWGAAQTWTWVMGSFASFFGGILTYRVWSDARSFARLARALPEVDLLEREALLPFARQGLRSAVPGVIFATFFALNLGDEGFWFAASTLGTLVLAQNVAMLLIPVRGLHERLRSAKREELARVNAAIRGEAGALRGSPLDGRTPALADLLAWRRFVESVPEWPIDVSTIGRFALYVGIPLISWVGAALVERMLDLAID